MKRKIDITKLRIFVANKCEAFSDCLFDEHESQLFDTFADDILTYIENLEDKNEG